MLKFNCNHFTNEFLTLLTGRGLPTFCNRAAYLGSFLHCLVPTRFLIVTPNMEGADCVGLDYNGTGSTTNEDDDD